MAKFLTRLAVEKVSEPKHFWQRATWRHVMPLRFWSDILQMTVTVPRWSETDFGSVPRLCLLYALFGDVGHASAAVHDYLCRTKLVPRAVADRVYREALAAEGVPAWRRPPMYAGVRVGAAWAAIKSHLGSL